MFGFGLLLHFAENIGSAENDASAPCYGTTKNIRVHPVVIPELKFRNVQRHVLGADLVKRADNAALHQRLETFNPVGVINHFGDEVQKVLQV
jgi:hypothetical protein